MLVADCGKALAVTIVDRREIELDTAAVRRALEGSPRAAQAFGLPPLVPTGVRCNSKDGCIEVVYGTLTATRCSRCGRKRSARC